MSVGWGRLPHLPLRCVLEHLSTEDALAASSTCRHWRSALAMYEGQKETIKLKVKSLEKCMFVTRLFKKNVRRLHIYIDTTGDEFEAFMNYVLTQYFDTLKLSEIVFIGPTYLQRNHYVPTAILKRIITESLIFKHIHSLNTLVLIGCEMGQAKSDNDRYTDNNVEYYSRPLSFNFEPTPADTVLSRCNTRLMMFSTLKYITIDYEHLSSATFQTLDKLPLLTLLTLNIGHKRPISLPRFDWPPRALNVAINIVAIPQRRFDEIMDHIFMDGLLLSSLKVMFCKALHIPLITTVVGMYKSTLKEFVWVDAPYESSDPYHRIITPLSNNSGGTCPVNPFIYLCWQCAHLRRLVIHGYWLWQYDVLGLVRLRTSLDALDVSAVSARQERFHCDAYNVARVLAADTVLVPDTRFVQQVNEHIDFKWKPSPPSKLHRALQNGASPEDRADYITIENTRPPVL